MLSEDKVKLAVEIFEKAPEPLVTQFMMIGALYVDYINQKDPSNEARTNYINKTYNAINVINKLIAVASNAIPVEAQVQIETNQTQQEQPMERHYDSKGDLSKAISTESAVEKKPVRKQSAKTKILKELDNWELDHGSFAFKALSIIPDLYNKKSKPLTIKDVITDIATSTGKTSSVVASSLSSMVKKTDFSKSDYTNLNENESVTKEQLIEALVNLCIE